MLIRRGKWCESGGLPMFRYLVFFGAAFYLALLIGGEDRGQQRMGLRGAYDVALAPPAPAPAPVAPARIAPSETAAPAETLRVLPPPPRRSSRMPA